MDHFPQVVFLLVACQTGLIPMKRCCIRRLCNKVLLYLGATLSHRRTFPRSVDRGKEVRDQTRADNWKRIVRSAVNLSSMTLNSAVSR